MPTSSQMLKCIVFCQILSNCYRPIQLFRDDANSKEIFLMAGEQANIEITIFEGEIGDIMSPKANYKQMSFIELKRYVLAHRNDEKAWAEFTSRERPYAIYFEADTPLSE
jgi:hypothetical protein